MVARVTLPKTGKIKLAPAAHRLLEKALTAMVRRPETFNMADWIYHDPTVASTRKTPNPYCGTVACLAGHITLAAGVPPVREITEKSLRGLPNAQTAYKVLAASELAWRGWINQEMLAVALLGEPRIADLFYRTEVKSPYRMVQHVKRWLRTGA